MKSLILTSLASLAAAAPSLTSRSTFCGQYDSQYSSPYTVYNNNWGRDAATSGSQCTTDNGVSGGSLSWSTSWTWAGGPYNVKSYANAVVDMQKKSLSSISSIPTTWNWSYSGSNIIANVAYDLFTSSTASGSPEYEFMIWVGALGGAGPISSTGSPVATVNLAGVTWDLYKGPNGQMTVFSFKARSNAQSFSGDLMDFVDYLTQNQGVSTGQILQSIGAGSEPFTGSGATLTVSKYSVSVN